MLQAEMKMRVSSRAKLIGSERIQDGIEPATCIDGMGGMMQAGRV